MGNLLKVVAHAANIGEREGDKQVLDRLWTRLVTLLADGGYDGERFQTRV